MFNRYPHRCVNSQNITRASKSRSNGDDPIMKEIREENKRLGILFESPKCERHQHTRTPEEIEAEAFMAKIDETLKQMEPDPKIVYRK